MGLLWTTVNMPAAGPQYVHQHLAPTGEHIRLLRDLEEAALDHVVMRHRINNVVNANCTILARPHRQDHLVVITMKLNGHDLRTEVVLEQGREPWNHIEFAEWVTRRLSEAIGALLAKEALTKLRTAASK